MQNPQKNNLKNITRPSHLYETAFFRGSNVIDSVIKNAVANDTKSATAWS